MAEEDRNHERLTARRWPRWLTRIPNLVVLDADLPAPP